MQDYSVSQLYPLNLSRPDWIKHYIFEFSLMLIGLCVTFSEQISGNMWLSFWAFGMMLFFSHIPVIVISAICSPAVGMFYVLCVFIAGALSNASNAYMTFAFMMLSAITSLLTAKGFFSTLKRALFSIVVLSLCSGNLWSSILYLLLIFHRWVS